MARSRGEDGTPQMNVLESTLKDLHANARNAGLVEAITRQGGKPPAGIRSPRANLAALDPNELVAAAEATGKPVSEIIRERRGLGGDASASRTEGGGNQRTRIPRAKRK